MKSMKVDIGKKRSWTALGGLKGSDGNGGGAFDLEEKAVPHKKGWGIKRHWGKKNRKQNPLSNAFHIHGTFRQRKRGKRFCAKRGDNFQHSGGGHQLRHPSEKLRLRGWGRKVWDRENEKCAPHPDNKGIGLGEWEGGARVKVWKGEKK